MELPIGNFFEVTINSHKLLSSIQQLHDRITKQDQVIEQLCKADSHLQGSIWENINQRLDKFSLEMERERRSTQEELNHFKLIVKDQDRHIDHKIAQFASNIVQLSKKIEGVQNSIQEDTSLKFSYLQRKIQNNLTAQDFQSLLKEDIQKYSLKLERLFEKQADDVKKLQDKIRNVAFLNETAAQQKQPIQAISNRDADPLSVTCNLGERKKAKSQTRKRLRTQRFGALVDQCSQVQQFREKMCQLEKKLNNSKENLNKKVEISSYIYDIKSNQILRQIMSKVTNISQRYQQKIVQFEQKIVKLNNKCQVVDQHIGILSRKIDRERLQLNDLSHQIKRIDQKRIDDKALENMKTSMKLIAKQFQQGIEAKLSKGSFQKQKNLILQKITRLFNLIEDKCNKGQVKKGLSFLEDKIKDIIIVLAEGRNLIKDSSTRKIQAKCLGCDKQLEPSPQDSIQNIHKSMRNTATSSLTGRASTSQLRKRIRVINGSTVGEDSCQ